MKRKYRDQWPGGINFEGVETPVFIIDERALSENLKTLEKIQKESGCKIILALKSFSCSYFFPLIRKKLQGVAAGSPWEARMGHEKFRKEVHVFSPAFRNKEEVEAYRRVASHMTFNSFSQWNRFREQLLPYKDSIGFGIRVNPEHSEVEWRIYDPSAPKSRFGVKAEDFEGQDLEGISGLHFHNLCELNADALERTLRVFERKFGKYLSRMKWVNFGGGHSITWESYKTGLLIKIIKDFKKRHPYLEVYLEPGAAVVSRSGILVATVVDILKNKVDVAILDASAAAHMPEVIELRGEYTPEIWGKTNSKKNAFECRLTGNTCMTGDIIGDYSFSKPLKIGEKIIFPDMAQYTMVRMNTFCGTKLPSIYARDMKGKLKLIRKFGFQDFERRLA